MLDIAWPELLVIGAVALVAIGPKDLPKVMRTMGQWAGKARGMMHDIHRAFDQLNYESEIAEKLKNQQQHSSAVMPPLDDSLTTPSKRPESDHDRPAAP